MQFWRKHPRLLRAGALLVAAVAAFVPGVLAPQGAGDIEELASDALWRLGKVQHRESRVVLLDIDDRSLQAQGPWPWPRATMAALSNRLADAGVQLQGYDIAFSEARSGDDELVAAWRRSDTVLAQLFSIDPGVTPRTGQIVGALGAAGCPGFAPRTFGYYGIAESLLAAGAATGHITPRVGTDGVVRQVPALVCHEGRAHATLSMAMLWRAAQTGSGADNPAPDWQWHAAGASPSPFPRGLAPPAWLTTPSLPGLAVPLDARGNLRVPYAIQREAFTSVSAADLLAGKVDARVLKGAIVLVGGTAFGMGDTIATPHASVASGLEVHTQLLVGLLDQQLPYTPVLWPWAQGGLMALVGGLLWALAVRRSGVPAKRLPLTGLVLALGAMAGVGLALLKFGLWLPWLPLVVFILVASAALATVEHAFARAQRERLSAHLGAYLPATVAQRLMASEPSGNVLLESREASVMVADIRNFSAFATHAEPNEVAALLHAFCCQAVDVVEKHGGVVENVSGDSILAVWTAQDDRRDHSAAAVAAAKELTRATRSLLAARVPVAEHSLIQPLALGIGLETGTAIVGSFGPTRRRAHAALGEPVTVANRLQQMTSDLSMPIILGPQLAAQLSPDGVEPLGEYLLEGLGKHYTLYAPVGWADLVSVDSDWATSAVGAAESHNEPVEWSRWGEAARPGRPSSNILRAPTALGRPSA
jgi:adenylate cyclase